MLQYKYFPNYCTIGAEVDVGHLCRRICQKRASWFCCWEPNLEKVESDCQSNGQLTLKKIGSTFHRKDQNKHSAEMM